LGGIEVKRGLDKNFPQLASIKVPRKPTSRNKREKGASGKAEITPRYEPVV
jgi:hypothetical protein